MAQLLEHKHLIVTAFVERPPVDPLWVTDDWLPRLINGIGMKALLPPFAVYHDMPGNRGLTGGCVIETSHVMLHVWDEVQPAKLQLDVYTCGPFDQAWVQPFLREFGLVGLSYLYVDRDREIEVLAIGTANLVKECA